MKKIIALSIVVFGLSFSSLSAQSCCQSKAKKGCSSAQVKSSEAKAETKAAHKEGEAEVVATEAKKAAARKTKAIAEVKK